ncbi:hypothetical protein PMI16_04258 [Herbaspirillum sp. CF444]|nr:hypothetical protein PMI16_04258 [Herbaspirillum sp. CF444]
MAMEVIKMVHTPVRQLPFAGITQIRFKGISHPFAVLWHSGPLAFCFSYYVQFQTSWAGFYTHNPARDITNFH